MANQSLLCNSLPDIISLIFSYIIFEANDFSGFAKLLLLWESKQSRSTVKVVLEKLNWDLLYEFHQHPMLVTRDQYHGFIAYSVRNKVQQAMFYDSTQKLFMHVNVEHYLRVLHTLSITHFPSFFSLLFFKAIYRPYTVDVTAQEMILIVKDLTLKPIVFNLINFFDDIYTNLVGHQNLLPLQKLCPDARNREPFNLIDGPPSNDELWESLCDQTVEENPCGGRNLSNGHIWKAECNHCTLQLIVYKILFNNPLY